MPSLSTIDTQYHPLWKSLRACFQRVTDAIGEEFPQASSEMFCYKAARRPFTGYDSFFARRDPSRTEDCTLMVEIVVSDDRLVATADISSGHGDLFAAAPEMSTGADPSEHELTEFLRSVEQAAEEFFTANVDEVRQALLAAEP